MICPEFVLKILGITHSAARFFWPIFYFMILCIAYAIQRTYGKKLSAAILICVASIQIIDLYPLYQSIKMEYGKNLTGLYDQMPLKSPLWNQAARKYKNLILIPAMNQPIRWETFASLAAKYGLATNSIFTARIDSNRVIQANKNLDKLIAEGKLDNNSFYVLQDRFVLPILEFANSASPMLRLDGFNVFLPNWSSCNSCESIPRDALLTIQGFRPKIAEPIYFAKENPKAPYYLGSGWSWLESWGVWSDSDEASMFLPAANGKSRGVVLTLQAFVVHEKLPEKTVEIYFNDDRTSGKKIIFNDSVPKIIKIPFNQKLNNPDLITIKISISNPISPKSLKIGNDDERRLGVGLISASFY